MVCETLGISDFGIFLNLSLLLGAVGVLYYLGKTIFSVSIHQDRFRDALFEGVFFLVWFLVFPGVILLGLKEFSSGQWPKNVSAPFWPNFLFLLVFQFIVFGALYLTRIGYGRNGKKVGIWKMRLVTIPATAICLGIFVSFFYGQGEFASAVSGLLLLVTYLVVAQIYGYERHHSSLNVRVALRSGKKVEGKLTKCTDSWLQMGKTRYSTRAVAYFEELEGQEKSPVGRGKRKAGKFERSKGKVRKARAKSRSKKKTVKRSRGKVGTGSRSKKTKRR